MIRRLSLCLLLTGCVTLKAYEGPKANNAALAIIIADPRINAGLPVVVALRKIDQRVVGIQYWKLAVDDGHHSLLVDCIVKETGSITRFPLEVDVQAGDRYRLRAELAPGNRVCDTVRLERL